MWDEDGWNHGATAAESATLTPDRARLDRRARG
jgi:hypothetical protein